jgi:hypothetical protein
MSIEDEVDPPWRWQGDGTDDLPTFANAGMITISAGEVRRLISEAEAAARAPLLSIISEAEADIRCMLDRVPECRGGGEDHIRTDDLGRVLGHEEQPTGTLISNIAMVRVGNWIEELDLALGQLRTFARSGELGDERLTYQSTRLFEGHIVPEAPTLHAMPDDAMVDVLAEIGRLAKLATRRKSECQS